MTNSHRSETIIRTIYKIHFAIDLIWATLVAFFASIFVGQLVSLLGAGSVAAYVGGAFIFVVAFSGTVWQGAIFPAAFRKFKALLLDGQCFKSEYDSKLHSFLSTYAVVYLLVNLALAALLGSLAPSLLASIGSSFGASMTTTTVGSVFLWGLGFGFGFYTSAAVLTLLTLICAYALYVWSCAREFVPV